MQVINVHKIKLRVYERGNGENLSCGTGACAAVAVGIEQGVLKSPVTVISDGGELTIEWQGEGYPVMMKGSATLVYDGVIEF